MVLQPYRFDNLAVVALGDTVQIGFVAGVVAKCGGVAMETVAAVVIIVAVAATEPQLSSCPDVFFSR